MKKLFQISVILVCLLLMLGAFSLPVSAETEKGVSDVINSLANGTYSSNTTYLKYNVGNYFNSKVTSACSPHTSSNACPDKTCISGSVIINGTTYSGSQCIGFAYDVFRIIFGERYGVTNIPATKITWDGVTDPATWIKNTVQTGDYIRFGGHSAIVVGTTSQYLRLYEANGYYSEYQTQPCRVTINQNRTWSSVSTKISNNGGSLYIWRATVNSSSSANDIWLLSPPDGVLAMRTGATTSATKIYDIPGGEYVTVTKYANDGQWDWGYTTYNGQSGWVCLYYATPHDSHSYGSWQTVTAATCTATGSQKRTCACGETETKSISASGHNYSSSFTIDTAATCTTTGSKSKHCSYCSAKTEITSIPAAGHTYGVWQTITVSSCTTAGSQKHVCSTCGNTEYKTTSALGHDYSSSWTIDNKATCTTAGTKSHHCSRCSTRSDITTVPATGHSWSDWTVTKQATYDSTGTKVRRCTASGCSGQETAIIAKLSLDGHTHNFGNWTTEVTATCDAAGAQKRLCTICDSYETQELAALGHSFGEWITEENATCTKEGTQRRTCTHCSESETLKTPVLGHSFGEWTVKSQTSADTSDTLERKCSNCSMIETQTISKPGVSSEVSNDSDSSISDSSDPDTAPKSESKFDATIIIIITCTILIASLLIAIIVLLIKRKK